MNIRKIPDEELRDYIMSHLAINDINKVHGATREEIADSFLAYTPFGRQLIIDYYRDMEKTKGKMNWINKTIFEHKYFYIGGTDALVAMMLLGFKVNEQREANVTMRSIEPSHLTGNALPRKYSFFKNHNVKSKISIPGGRNGIDQEVITMPNKQQYTLSEALAMMQYIEGNDDINPFEHSDLLEINEIVEHELKKRGR